LLKWGSKLWLVEKNKIKLTEDHGLWQHEAVLLGFLAYGGCIFAFVYGLFFIIANGMCLMAKKIKIKIKIT
jgi:hypothetical protein